MRHCRYCDARVDLTISPHNMFSVCQSDFSTSTSDIALTLNLFVYYSAAHQPLLSEKGLFR